MLQQSVLLLALSFTISLTQGRAEEGKNIVSSTLRSATVYRSGAELVHTATARLEQGSNDLIIDDVSNTIDEGSIRIGCSGNVTIMSVSFATEYLKPETTSPFVKRLRDSIESVKKELTRLDMLTKSDNELLDLLNANKSIGSTQAGVTVTDLSKMMDYYRQKIVELHTEQLGYNERTEKLRQLSDKLDNQIKEEEKKNAKTAGRILLQLLSPLAGSYDFTVSYLTIAAHWNPFYDLKVDNNTDPLRIIYKARLVQTSGIDWKHVKLSLSTSLPSQGGNAPILKTWFLRFVDPAVWMDARSNSMSNTLESKVTGLELAKSQRLDETVVIGYGSPRTGETREYTDPIYVVNGKEMSPSEFYKIDKRAIKNIEELKGKDATQQYGARGGPGVYIVTLKEELEDYISVNDNQMDVTFDIDIPYDVPANGKEQGVVLKEYKMPCSYQYYAAPRVDKDAFLLGEMAGWEKLNLLPGEASIMVEGTYIGKSFIDPNSIQDTLNLTLGRDKRIVVRKEKVVDYSSVKFLGANKKEVFTYQITVRNNKKEKIQMMLKDQYPISSSKDIEEDLLDSSGASVNKDTGMLTWKIELAPGESRKYRVSYSIKYPKDKTLNLPATL